MKINLRIIILSVTTCLLLYIISPLAFANGSNSTIGGIAVSDLKKDELREALINGIHNWKKSPITIEGAGTSLEIDSSSVEFDLDSTIAQYESQTDKSRLAFWKKSPVVHIPFVVKSSEAIKQQIASQPLWETDATYSQFLSQASYLRSQPIEAVVAVYSKIDNERLATAIREVPSEIVDTQKIVDLLTDRIIKTNEEYSFLTEADSIMGSASRDTLNFVASLIYEVALRMNGQIVERHQHQALPTYISPGLDAFIQISQQKDLRFINTLEQPVQLKLTREGLNLKAEIFAAMSESTATVRVSRDQDVEPRIITRYSQELPIGQRRLIQEGAQGLRVSVYRTNNATGEEKVISRDYYPPTNIIYLESSRQPVENVAGSSEGSNGTGNPGDAGESSWTDGSNGNGNESWTGDESGTSNGGTGSGSSKGEPVYDKGGNIINSGK